MPTERFFNLPEEKQQRIFDAAWKEMSSVPFEEVSINKIIRTANIPRGSFYQYFMDKHDLLNYMLTEYRENIQRLLETSLQENGGDCFAAIMVLYQYTLHYGLQPENRDFCLNIFSSNEMHEGNVDQILEIFEDKKPLVAHWKQVAAESFRYTGEDDLRDILELLIVLFRSSVIQIFNNIDQRDRLEKSFKNKMEILKHGILKHPEEANV